MIGSSCQSFPHDDGRSDPMTQFLGNMANTWARGLEAWQVFAGVGSGSRSDRANLAMGTMIAPMENVAKLFEPFMPRTPEVAAAAEAGQAAFVQIVDLSPTFVEACMVGTSSAIRCQIALAELVFRYGTSLAQAAADRATGRNVTAPSDCRVLADELRAFVRGIGDLATREARRLEYELERVGETIAQATDQATPPPSPYQHRRRHQMKP